MKTAYENFYQSAAENDVFDEKTTRMIQLSAAFAIGCYP